MKNWIQLTLILTLFFSMAPAVVVEGGTVFLKNGHVVNGKVIASDAEKVILTWSNGRATIYRRFISEVVLESSEQEYLARRFAAREPQVSHEVNTHIQLPELADLLPTAEADSGDQETASDSSFEVLEPVESVDHNNSSDTLGHSVAVELVSEEAPPPVFHREELVGLNLFVDLPEPWKFISVSGAARISWEQGAVMIALDRYLGDPDVELIPEAAANSLGDRLEAAGFERKSSGRAAMLAPLRPSFTQESSSPDGQKSCIHALVPSQEGTLLISIYSPMLTDSHTDDMISSIVASLGSPVASR